MKLWQLYTALVLSIAAVLGAFAFIGTPSQQIFEACLSPAGDIDRDACAAIGR